MEYVKEINEREHILVAINGFTISNGGGMGDSGGYPTVYTYFKSKKDALHEKAKDDNIRLFAISEICFENLDEYRTYLKLEKKYKKLSDINDGK